MIFFYSIGFLLETTVNIKIKNLCRLKGGGMELFMSIYHHACTLYPFEGLPDLSADYNDIDAAYQIFSSDPPWKSAKKSGLYHSGYRTVNMLNAAKILCDYFSQLIFSEQVSICADNASCQEFIESSLNSSGFRKKIPEWLSFAFALGGGVIKSYIYNGRVCLDFVHADRFIPLSWDNNSITSGAFMSVTHNNGFFYTLFERHAFDENSGYFIEHRLYKSKYRNSLGDECPLEERYPLLSPVVFCGCSVPLFTYFRPAVSNNRHPDSPLGLSVITNTTDTVKALDIAFDSFSREFVLGKKRIIVPSACVQTVVDLQSGEQRQYFDADDEAYVALKCDEDSELKITDNTVSLRVEEHIDAINALLNILCFQTGLSAGTFSFDVFKGVRTATEILYRDSKTAGTAKNNRNILSECFKSVARSILSLGVSAGHLTYEDTEHCQITVGWHDGIVCDDNTLIDNNIKLVSAGLKSRLTAVMEIMKCDEKTAQEEIDRISQQ